MEMPQTPEPWNQALVPNIKVPEPSPPLEVSLALHVPPKVYLLLPRTPECTPSAENVNGQIVVEHKETLRAPTKKWFSIGFST